MTTRSENWIRLWHSQRGLSNPYDEWTNLNRVPRPTPDQREDARRAAATWALTQNEPESALREALAALGLLED